MTQAITPRRVVVTGMGTINCLGHNVADTWQKIAAGECGIGPIEQFDTTGHKTQIGGEVKGFVASEHFSKRDARRIDRVSQLAVVAAREALADAKFDTLPEKTRARTGVVIGTGIGGIYSSTDNMKTMLEKGPSRVSPHYVPMMLPDTSPARISLEFGLRGPNMALATACASSTNAIGETARMVALGGQDVMVTGGTEAALNPLTLAGFNNMGAMSTWNDRPLVASRPFDLERSGFVPGEGAAILVLEALEHALARGAHIYGEIIGYGSTADAFHITAPDENGIGAIESMEMAFERAGIGPEAVDYINAHGTSTKLNDQMETRAVKKLFGDRAYEVPMSSTKGMHGHLLGAGGALEFVICLKAVENGLLPPTINYTVPDPELDLDYVPNVAREADINVFMSNSFGFGGHNATLIGRKFVG